METKAIIKGWEDGFAKISSTKLVKEYTDFGLSEAKKVVDDILEGTESVLCFENEEIALEFIGKAVDLGYICLVKSN